VFNAAIPVILRDILALLILTKAIMFNFNNTIRAALAGALLLVLQPAAHAAGQADGTNGYYDMCLKSVDMPKPFGESDLKGNAKLPQYCGCFAPLFMARAQKAMKYMQEHPGKAPPGTLEESNAEELALRNTCRKQVGLPLATDPNGAMPAAPKAKRPSK
jgi:hypothetical protein